MKKERLLSKSISKLFLLVSAFALAITFVVENPTQVITAEGKETSINQTVVGNDLPVHDPSIIKVDDTYYVFGTHGAAAKSTDLMDWENFVNNSIGNHTLLGNIPKNLEEVFTWAGNSKAADIGGMGIWAPDVYYNEKFVNQDGSTGAYLMYFSISTGQDEVGVEHYRSLIGLASSQNVEGPYQFENVVVYSGFLDTEGKSHYENTDFNDVFPGASPRSGYFNNGRFNFDYFPNAIDPTIVEGKDGSLHMSYGSWNGGIWVLDLNPETGLPIRPENYAGGIAHNTDDSYFGSRISGGFKTSGEGSYVEYHEASGYYHLYVTYGGLIQNDTYNVRFFRSKNINGPYVDSEDNNPKFEGRTDNASYGDRILGSFEFLENQTLTENAGFYSYRVPGHNSVLYGDDGNDYIIFHTRFKDKGEGHAVRVHQLLFDEEGWPLVAASRYEKETVQTDLTLNGKYALVFQGKDNSKSSKESVAVSFNQDGSVSGAFNGSYTLEDGKLQLTVGADVYEGYVLNQGTSLTDFNTDITITLRGVSDKVKGHSVLGVRLSQLDSEAILKEAVSALDIKNKNSVIDNINLPSLFMGAAITWESDQEAVVSSNGVVTRPEEDTTVTLTATLTYEGISQEKTIAVKVLDTKVELVYHYEFDESINESNHGLEGSSIGGAILGQPGGTENYTSGIVKDADGNLGSAFRFDGSTGIELPKNIIDSDVYTVSMWLKPESLTHFTSLFFGATSPSSWVSFAPVTGHDDIKDTALLWSGEQWYMGGTNVSLPLNAWSLVSFSNDQGTLKVYIDGVEVFKGEGFPNIFGTDLDSFFGLGVNYWDPAFKGSVDDLKIYPDSVLSAEAIKEYYDKVMYVRTPEDIATDILNTLTLPSETEKDLNFKTAVDGVNVTWKSSNTSVISNTGKVTQPAVGSKDVTVTVTASIEIDGREFTKEFTVKVIAKQATVKLTTFTFDKTLESNVKGQTGLLNGKNLHLPGGNEAYTSGIVNDADGRLGSAFRFDGSTGIELPKNIIDSDVYTVSMWLKPEEFTYFTSLFFGATSRSSWVSFAPVTGHDGITDTALLWSGEQWYMGETNVSLPLNTWSLVSFSNDQGTLKVYIDGVEVFKGEGFPNIFGTDLDSFFGLGVNYWNVPFKGSVDDLRIYPDSVWSAKDIKAYYDDVLNVRSPEQIAEDLLNSLLIPAETEKDLSLKSSVDGVKVSWSSSNPSVISTTGKVTQPAIGQKDVSVRLTASVTVDNIKYTKEFVVKVLAKQAVVDSTIFTFDKTLDSNVAGKSGSVVGNFINQPGGTLNYKPGIVGDGVYLDGSTGILLPKNLITSNKYSVSMWMNPEQLTGFTTAFFAEGPPTSWISIVPQSGNVEFNGSAMVWSGEQWYDGVLNKTLPTNAWTHITVDVNHGNIEVYLNGVLAHKGDSFPDVFKNHNDNVFALGVNFWDTPFKGTIDELRILPNGNVGAQGAKAYYDSIMSSLSPLDILNQYLNSLSFGVNGVVTEDVTLPTQTPAKQALKWKSSNTKFISNKGKVTRPTAAQGDQKVTLSVSVMLDGKEITKTYEVIVKALPMKLDKVTYSFDGHLNDSSNNALLTGSTTGQFIDTVGKQAQYKDGKVGKGIYLDGTSGIRLPDNLITGNTYSVSMWMKPEQLSDFSTTFFGLKNNDAWVSFTPRGVAQEAVLWSGTQWYDGLTGEQFSNDQWRHVAFTVHNGTVKVYIDGVQRHTGTNFPLLFNELSDQIFGLGVNYWDAPFKGVIDELVVETKRVMSAQEIYQYYDATVGSDRFSRNVTRSIKYEFEGNVGNARVTGDRIDNSGGTVSYQEGVVGEAVYLNGSSGLRLPDNFLSSDTYSMQMWVKPESITQFSSLFFGGTSTSSWVNLPASGIDGKTMFWSGEQWYDALTSKSIPANRWSHLAVSVSKGNVSVYIDGELEFSGTGFPDIFDSKNTFAGIGVNFWDLPYKGLVDEFEIDNNVARNAEAIKVYYETTKPEQEEFERNQEKDHHFKFDEDLKDSLDETLEGVVIGDKIGVEGGNLEFVEGKDGKAVYLDGNTGILLPEELITSESYSVSFWLNPESISEHTPTFFGAQTDASWLSVVPQSGEFTNGNSMVWSGTEWYDGNLGKQIELDVWTHVAFSVDQGILKGYLDGELVFTGEGFPDIFTQEGSVFALGVNYWDSPFVGALDDLMIFDSRVLSDQDVSDIAGGKFSIDKPVVDKDIKEDEEETKAPILAYVGGGAVGLGAIAYVVKRFLDAKKAA